MKKIKRIWWILTNAKKFRVLYPCGRYSVRMEYSIAKDYAEIFGGELTCIDSVKNPMP